MDSTPGAPNPIQTKQPDQHRGAPTDTDNDDEAIVRGVYAHASPAGTGTLRADVPRACLAPPSTSAGPPESPALTFTGPCPPDPRVGHTVSQSEVREYMSKQDAIELEGTVTELLPNATFRVTVQSGHEVLTTLAGNMRRNRIRVLAGDRVTVEVSPYDLTRGRITFRHKN